MECIFLNSAGQTLFVRSDMESGHWTQEQMNMTADFPFDPAKKIERGMRIAFRDPANDGLEVFEIRIVVNHEPEHFQQITAENIALAELSDEHMDGSQITSQTAAQALATALTGTLWSVGNVDIGSPEERADIQQRIDALSLNGNVDLTNRPIISPETMHEAGYTDFDGDYATLYSMTYTETLSGGQLITTLFTPIRENGTVLSQNQIDDYVITLHSNSSSISALKANDIQRLLIHALPGEQIDEMDAIAEEAHDLSDEWEVCTTGGVQSADFSRGSVWDAVSTIRQNWNVFITPRVVISSAGAIIGRYLDIAPAQGVFRGLRLAVRKNLLDPAVTYDDEDVYTAMYGYGGNVDKPQTGGDDTTEELTFADEVWTATADHPAKPAGQTYLEWPEKTALYGRNGRPRFGYYQNGNIKNAGILLEKTWESLQLSSSPKISIAGTVVDLYRLGYHDQPIRLHDRVIVEIEETGEVFDLSIICCDIDLNDPTGSRVDIGAYIPNIIYINRDTAEKAGGGGGGGRGPGSMTNLEDDEAKYETWFEKNDQLIGLFAGIKDGDGYLKTGNICLAINDSDDILAYINADHINISATSTAHMLAGDLEHDANGKLIIKSAGGMYVQRTESGTTSQFGVWDTGNLTGGVMVQQINGQTAVKILGGSLDIDSLVTTINSSQVQINAERTTIAAFLAANTVTMGSLTVTNFTELNGLDCGNIDCTGLNANVGTVQGGTGDFDNLTVGSSSATWQSTSVTSLSSSTLHYFLYAASSGSTTPTGTVSGRVITNDTTKTIYYLGRASA